MFGMTVEKVLFVLMLVAIVVGPHRLPGYAHRLAGFIRAVRSFTDAARRRVETEVGAPLSVDEWRSLDPRRYDPRRIMRDALMAPDAEPARPSASAVPAAAPSSASSL